MTITTDKRGKRKFNMTDTTFVSDNEIEKAAEGQPKRENTTILNNEEFANPDELTTVETQGSTSDIETSKSSVPETAEDLLRAAKEETRKQSNVASVEKNEVSPSSEPDTVDTVTGQLNTILGESVTQLVNSASSAQQAVVAMLISEGLNDVVEASSAYQVGLLLGLSQVKVKNLNDLSEQIAVLRSHINRNNAEIVGQSVKALIEATGNEQIKPPLLMAVREIPKLKII